MRVQTPSLTALRSPLSPKGERENTESQHQDACKEQSFAAALQTAARRLGSFGSGRIYHTDCQGAREADFTPTALANDFDVTLHEDGPCTGQ